MNTVGIEKINIYGSSLFLRQRNLAVARNKDPDKVVSDFLIDSRSLNPPWEDTVTMGSNAAFGIIDDEDRESIGMLIAGTEGSVDFGKPISTNIHEALGLNPNVRNYETKHACYSGVAALDTAVNWVASGLNKGRKALVISTDFSRMHLNLKEEFVLGGVAAALLVSNDPKVLEFELDKKGTWTTNIYDTFRPSARHEVGNNEVSLFTYMDALEGSYNHFLQQFDSAPDFDTYFKYNIYHTPFPGMAFQAHRTLCNINRPRKKAEIKESFNQKVMPVLRYARRLGSTYGSSNFVGLCSVIKSADDLQAGDRLSFFAYGSGAIGEFYSGRVGYEARKMIDQAKIDEALDSRREVTVDEYEMVEKSREDIIEAQNFTPDFSILDGFYQDHYEGSGLLVLKEVKDFYRTYERS
jgi:hydroxymethylglutaryl-CoA synthase